MTAARDRFAAAASSGPGPFTSPWSGHPGYMLSLDFTMKAGMNEFCTELDQRVLAAGGRLYFAKESRTTPEMVRATYPRLDEWRRIRDAADPERVFVSDLARRLRLVDDQPVGIRL